MNYPQVQDIDTQRIVENIGQIPEVPKNPRTILDERFALLRKSIKESPEFMLYRPLLLYPFKSKYVCIGGNMRFKAAKAEGWQTIPALIFPEDTSKAKLREYAMKDNNPFGKVDFDVLRLEWDKDECLAWGTDPSWLIGEEPNIDALFEDYDGEQKAKGVTIFVRISPEQLDRQEEIKEAVKKAVEKFDGVNVE